MYQLQKQMQEQLILFNLYLNPTHMMHACIFLQEVQTSQMLCLVNSIKTFIYFLKIGILLGQPSNNKTELKVTQRLRLDQHKLDDLEKKLRTSVTNALSNTNLNGQSTPTGGRKQTNPVNQTKFAILITSPKTSQRKSNGKANSPNHPLSSDENDDRSQAKKDAEADDESSLSRLISYLAA
jgi:hypothetical protein